MMRNQRGIALPMALIALLVLSSITLAFAVLSQSEPVISNNQNRAAVARAMAESGMERAIWALTAGPGTPGGVAAPAAGATAAAPYDGTGFFQVGRLGGFTLSITGAAVPNTANLVAVGWMNSNTSSTNAHRKVTATLIKFPDFGLDPNCALCVKGDVQVSGSAVVDARADTSCGRKYGVVTTGRTTIGNNNNGNNGAIYGAVDGNGVKNEATDYRENQPAAAFDAFTFTQDQLNALKLIAKANGTYYGPGSPYPGQSTYAGTVTVDSSHPIPRNGVVFFDTYSGAAMSPGNIADYVQVDIHGNPFPDTVDHNSTFTGWIIVMGSASYNANGVLNGLLYLGQDVTSTTGTPQINGVVIAQNLSNANGSQVDVSESGNALVNFDCAKARGSGKVPTGWLLDAGTYKEVSD
jgi:Tfp pilus assembly protein PilV